MEQSIQPTNQIPTLEAEVKTFADSLPYWAKYLSNQLLSGNKISDEQINIAYTFLLEDAGLTTKSTREEINITYTGDASSVYKKDLLFNKLQQVEGVNALVENQVIEFNKNVTVVFGMNGSGKTSYIRLLKKALFSRAGEEQLIPNVHLTTGHKPTKARFVFSSAGEENVLTFPDDQEQPEFAQFAVFDSKCVPVHLNSKNEFEFRPAGLCFFADLINSYKKVEAKIFEDINTKTCTIEYPTLFDGESDIKKLLENINAKTKISDLRKHLPFTTTDFSNRNSLEEKKAQLITLKKDKEITTLQEYKTLIETLKRIIIDNNKYFTSTEISKVQSSISDCINKEEIAKKDGIDNFKSDSLKSIGSNEWKLFIEAADNFAKLQSEEDITYPEEDDLCLLCQQPLSIEARELIKKYWLFLKSQAEQESKAAQEYLDKVMAAYQKLNFTLLPPDNILTKWLSENFPEELRKLVDDLQTQAAISEKIITDLETKSNISVVEYQVLTAEMDNLLESVDKKITDLKEKEPTIEIDNLNKTIVYLNHKEKLEQHIDKIEEYINNLIWAATATKLKSQLATRKITDKEKELSGKYFNQAYIDTFNNECKELQGDFGIEINYTGSLGTSYRQLKLKSKQPSDVLSEGEQKVISIADFLSEMQLSEINKGIIFDDPVNSLDEERKSIIAKRLAKEAFNRQVIIFTHDLVFVSSLIASCEEIKMDVDCHWIEKLNNQPGTIWLKNTPSFEKSYKKPGKAQDYYTAALKCGPEEREDKIKNGFGSLRTSYEALVVFDLFEGVVQRFSERVSVDSLTSVFFDETIKGEICDSFYKCCRYMEGHSHSDKYAYLKPSLNNLKEEIQRFTEVKKKLTDLKKNRMQN